MLYNKYVPNRHPRGKFVLGENTIPWENIVLTPKYLATCPSWCLRETCRMSLSIYTVQISPNYPAPPTFPHCFSRSTKTDVVDIKTTVVAYPTSSTHARVGPSGPFAGRSSSRNCKATKTKSAFRGNLNKRSDTPRRRYFVFSVHVSSLLHSQSISHYTFSKAPLARSCATSTYREGRTSTRRRQINEELSIQRRAIHPPHPCPPSDAGLLGSQ